MSEFGNVDNVNNGNIEVQQDTAETTSGKPSGNALTTRVTTVSNNKAETAILFNKSTLLSSMTTVDPNDLPATALRAWSRDFVAQCMMAKYNLSWHNAYCLMFDTYKRIRGYDVYRHNEAYEKIYGREQSKIDTLDDKGVLRDFCRVNYKIYANAVPIPFSEIYTQRNKSKTLDFTPIGEKAGFPLPTKSDKVKAKNKKGKNNRKGKSRNVRKNAEKKAISQLSQQGYKLSEMREEAQTASKKNAEELLDGLNKLAEETTNN